MLVLAYAAGSDEQRRSRTRLAWKTMGGTFVLWFIEMAARHSGLCEGWWAAVIVTGCGWAFLPRVSRLVCHRLALVLHAVWLLVGAHLAIMTGITPFFHRPWGPQQAALMAGGLCLMALVLFFGRTRPEILASLWGSGGVKAALALTVVAALMSFTSFASGVWAMSSLAYLIGITIVSSRTEARRAVPGNLGQWWEIWKWPIVMASLPGATLLLPTKHHTPDLAPAVILALCLLVAFGVLGQRRAAVLLFGLAIGLGGICLGLGVPHRLAGRLPDVLRPEDAGSPQQIRALWSLVKGGLVGDGTFTLVGGLRSVDALRLDIHQQPLTPLSATDAIWTLTAEQDGALGVLSLLVCAGIVATFLYTEATGAKDYIRRVFHSVVLLYWCLSVLLSVGWVLNRLPVTGVASPILSAGIFNAVFWSVLLALAAAMAVSSRTVGEEWQTKAQPPTGTLAPVLMVFIALSVWNLTGLSAAVWNREESLSLIYEGRADEDTALDAIAYGQVGVNQGRVVVFDDVIRRAAIHPQRRANLIHRWVKKGVFRATRDGRVLIRAHAFRQAEPTVGEALYLVERNPL